MNVWVVMSNDFPDAVFDNIEAAERYCDAQKIENLKNRESGYGRMVYWRSYEFPLKTGAE